MYICIHTYTYTCTYIYTYTYIYIYTYEQKHALPVLSANYDIMACAQTGSCKTAAFLFPMISMILRNPGDPGNGRCSFPRGLILAPTRELVQIYDEARKFCYKTGLCCAVAYGGGNCE
jgi:ATP-dependent RNA helicase DDX3X